MKHNTNTQRQAAPAFTLVELLVSIAAIALLTTGVGRIFTSVSSLVSTGSAISEVNQVARTLERQLREDIASFNRMRPEETFFAIRMREVGDIDHNGMLDVVAGEIPIYLSIEDRDADRRDIAEGLIDGPYDEGSRAVTKRVDEMMFLGFNGSDLYGSFQVDPTSVGGDAKSTHARIYYGHGLRPIPDPEWPPTTGLTNRRAPTRWYYIDGDFGSSASPVIAGEITLTENRFDPNSQTLLDNATGRNEFAQQWPLLRQPLLLYGGEAAGFPPSGSGLINSPIGYDREIAPFPRDLELEQRLDSDPFILIDNETDFDSQGLINNDRPDYRRIRDGRVDVCAMTHLDVRRWLEGADGSLGSGVPFQSGRLSNLSGSDPMDPATVNLPLWIQDGGVNSEINNQIGVQRAIAGMFHRIQVESAPPRILRASDPSRDEPLQPEDALMDLHAVLSTRCSNFEIAWGDGSAALADIDFNGDGKVDIKWGEMIWYDITPLKTPVSQTIDRSLFQNWSLVAGDLIDDQSADKDAWNNSEITDTDTTNSDGLFYSADGYHDESTTDANSMSGNGGSVPVAPGDYAAYSTFLNGGAPKAENEAFAIFPFRKPKEMDTGWSGAWDKAMLLRVRVTLHDTLGRLPEGKDFEFIFVLDPQGF